jgi:hypothetical protein
MSELLAVIQIQSIPRTTMHQGPLAKVQVLVQHAIAQTLYSPAKARVSVAILEHQWNLVAHIAFSLLKTLSCSLASCSFISRSSLR